MQFVFACIAGSFHMDLVSWRVFAEQFEVSRFGTVCAVKERPAHRFHYVPVG